MMANQQVTEETKGGSAQKKTEHDNIQPTLFDCDSLEDLA